MTRTKPQKSITHLLLLGTLFAVIALTLLLISYDIFVIGGIRLRTYIALGVIGYVLLSLHALHHGHRYTANWMLIGMYAAAASTTLLFWGLNAPVGILAVSLVIVLTGLLMGSRHVPYVTVGLVGILVLIQLSHALGIFTPDTAALHLEASFWDVIGYAVMFSIYSLIAWSLMRRTEKTLNRAKRAEKTVRAQNEQMSIELERQAAQLREEQLTQTRQLYTFALIGQSAAALLHELSSRLSIINYDLDDLKQQVKNSAAIRNAEESVSYINEIVRNARQQLTSYDAQERIAVRKLIHTIVKDAKRKPAHRAIVFEETYLQHPAYTLHGDPIAFSHILTILITNACEASLLHEQPAVQVRVRPSRTTLRIEVRDNGPGIDPERVAQLFNPHISQKAKGMGVGLYIAKHLSELCFRGSITYRRTTTQTIFSLSLDLTKATQ